MIGTRPLHPGSCSSRSVPSQPCLGYLWVWGRRYGLDLRVYRQSVEVWHRGENPYLALFTGSHLAYTYPPFSLVVFTPLRWVSLAASQWAMWAISIAAAIVSIWTVLR